MSLFYKAILTAAILMILVISIAMYFDDIVELVKKLFDENGDDK